MTKAVVQKILDQNGGFATSTNYRSKNFTETCYYTVRDGVLFIRRVGKGSGAASRFDIESIADSDQTRRFVKNFFNVLKSRNIE